MDQNFKMCIFSSVCVVIWAFYNFACCIVYFSVLFCFETVTEYATVSADSVRCV